MKLDSLSTLLASGHVLRCHTIPCVNRASVGLHTWRTLVLLHWVYHPSYPPPHVTYLMLIHDMPEVYTGDMPGNIKADNINVAKIFHALEIEFEEQHGLDTIDPFGLMPTEIEKTLIKFCDHIDLFLYAIEEIQMGNSRMKTVANKAYDLVDIQFTKLYCYENLPYMPRVEYLMTYIRRYP